jgi:hypothetical protein
MPGSDLPALVVIGPLERAKVGKTQLLNGAAVPLEKICRVFGEGADAQCVA